MQEYSVELKPGWDKHYSKLDSTLQDRIWKKILQLKTGIQGRHLRHGLPFFVEEAGGYRIAYTSDEETRVRVIYFAGSHKDYEKWFRKLE